MINIIGGKFKRKKINVPNVCVRPTSAIKRQAIFSIIESYAIKNSFDLYKEKCCIDFFSGSGALGLEAISRGMSFAYFFEHNNLVSETLLKNCNLICKKNEFNINNQDINYIKKIDINYPVSIIFIDPPYQITSFDPILKTILKNKLLNNNSIIILESHKKNLFKIDSNFQIIKEKIYGKTKIIFLKKLK